MSKIGRYEVEAEIGRGAMGVVYLALDPRLQRRLAIKTYRLPEGLSDDQRREAHERFMREAQAAAGLSHPGIVTVFDIEEDDASGAPFIAMEYVEGETLRERLDGNGTPPADLAIEMVVTLAEALDSAHRADIVHRDLKPGNVLVTGEGQVKIADFGVARLATSELTRTGMTLGSPAYMSPEHITTGKVDGRSDLFSLAVILYELLCGCRPFAGEELASLAYAIVHESPCEITTRVPELGAGFDAFFARALSKAPEDRFQTGADFAAALAALLETDETPAGETPAFFPPVVSTPSDPLDPVRELIGTETTPIALPAEDDNTLQLGVHPADTVEDSWEDVDRPARSRRWILVAAFALVLLLGARWAWGGRAYVDVQGRSSVRAGSLTLSVDGREVFQRDLAARGAKAKRLLRKAVGIKEEKFNESIRLRPGKHEIIARLASKDGESTHQESIVVEVARGDRRTLKLAAGSGYGQPLSLKLD